MECLDEIIGLSRTECECFLDQLPNDSDAIPNYNVSKSGIFLDELPEFNIEVASGADDCGKGGIWERMNRAVENAKLDYKNGLMSCVGLNYKPRIDNFNGQLGQSSYKGDVTISHTYAGMRVYPLQVKGGFIILKKIGVLINSNAPVTLYVYSNENGGTLLYSSATPLNAVANTLTWATLATPLELPMWSTNKTSLKYYVLMLLNGSWKPKANKASCGCGGNKEPYTKWMNIEGTSGNDLTDIDTFQTTSELNGIVLDVDVKCKASEIICSSQYPLDFENDPNALSMAYAIRMRAGAILYGDILSSGNINRFTMMNTDYMGAKIKEWNDVFTQWVNYACKNSNNIGENDCWICKQTATSLTKKNIVVTDAGLTEY